MRGFFILTLILMLLNACPAQAAFKIFQKKDYKQIFLRDALNAEKRHDDKSAFHSYEKALYYYKKDKKVIESYAQFCERQKYFDRAEDLYAKLYVLTKDKEYLFKKNLCAIKNGKLSDKDLDKLTKVEGLNPAQKNELNTALIYHYSYKGNWAAVSKTCDKIPKKSLGRETITNCIVANEKTANKKNSLDYYLRFSELYPNDSEAVKKIISLAEETKNYTLQESFIIKLSALNPKDNGIKYKLAGFYEKHNEWAKAGKIYESLIAGGDTNEHVKTSFAYVLSQLNPKTRSLQSETIKYIPKPLSAYKLAEKEFYEALNAKNYSKALPYLDKMLKKEPKNTKLLKHKADIAFAQNNYKEAISFLEKIQKIKPLSIKDEKFLAFLYSKTENPSKSLEIIESLLLGDPNNKELLSLVLEYSMVQKNWDKSITYSEKLLTLEPNSESILKNIGDLYSIKKDFPNAVKFYEKLVIKYPKPEYEFDLANLYMANQDFTKAEEIFEALYKGNPNNSMIIESYLNALLAQQKTKQAYSVIKTHHLEYTKDGYMVMGDIAMTNKDYYTAEYDYRNALKFDPESILLQNKLANSYRSLDCINKATHLFRNILVKDPTNLEARLGLGSLEIDKKNFEKARRIFNEILKENPDYKPAKIAIVHSYIANDDKLAALDTLKKIPQDNETKLMKLKLLFDMQKPTSSNIYMPIAPEMNEEDMEPNINGALNGSISKDLETFDYKKKRNQALTITPSYSFFLQQLSDEFNLDYHKFGINVAKNIDGNKNFFMDYNVIVYSSGAQYYYNNVVNEFKGGIQSRPNEKWEYRIDMGVKAFEFGDGMIIADDWIKHYFSDKFTLKVGYKRNNIEQSYTSAVGQPINGIFTGRACDNKFYFETQHKLPHQIYAYGLGSVGFIYAQNLPTNNYFEGMIGIGKVLYNNPKNKWIKTFAADLVSYNSSYQYNLLKLYSNTGRLFGGYFSPAYFTANTLNLKAEGSIRKLHLRYGVKGFGGIQHAISADQTTPTWGFSPYLSYDINNHITINLAYNHFTYADLVRDQFMVNAVIREFKKNAKN